MPSRRRKKRKKQRKTGVDYGTPKTPWNTETPTRAEDNEESIPREAQRVCEEERREKEENIDDLQQDIQRWWKAYGLSQCIIHDALPRLYNKRRSRREIFIMNKIKIAETLSTLYGHRLEMQLEEEERVERERKSEKEMEMDRRWFKDRINEIEECWENIKNRCAERRVSTDVISCPAIKTRFLTQSQEGRDELTQWATDYYAERWFAWEERNIRELERIDMMAEVMTERRREMTQVLTGKIEKARIAQQVRASIEAESLKNMRILKMEADYKGSRLWRVMDRTARRRRTQIRRGHQMKRRRSIGEGCRDKTKEDAIRRSQKKARWWEFPVPGPPESVKRTGQEEMK